MSLLEILKKFLDKNLISGKPVLLAYSGGVDSSCLLDLLLKCKNEINFELHVVHINHGWREESELEACAIEDKMKKLNIRLHYQKFKIDSNKNLENESRNKRIDFFKFLYKKYDYQALILAHQKDDLAETVLKRVLEGANIFSLSSMKEIIEFENMIVWRPLLGVSREDILAYNRNNNIQYFLDKTNEDTKYLRAKMRKDLFPFLQKSFNKGFIDNLVYLSNYSSEINNYLEKKTNQFFKNQQDGLFGTYIDLNEVKELIEIRFIIKKIVVNKNIEMSRDVLNQLSNWILEKKPNLRLNLRDGNIFADRGCFFILNNKNRTTNEKILLTQKLMNFGSWEVKINNVNNFKNNGSWKDFFNNETVIYVPDDKYFIYYPDQSRKLKKIWENSKVPSFLRRLVPVVCNEKKIVYDFLSGRRIPIINRNILQISLKLK
jgi:tRNA(Ile)-lysidine synthase